MQSYIEICPGTYREDTGFWFETFAEGMVIQHRPGRTITETDNTWGSLLAMNQHPVHIDSVYAESTEFKQILVSSLVTFSIVNGMTVRSISQKGIANLGWDRVRLLAPVFIGDTLYAQSTVLKTRLSRSRQGQGIVSISTIGTNQKANKVIAFDRTVLVPCKTTCAQSHQT